MKNSYNGVINFYKEPGMSSNGAMQKVRHLCGKVKAGHTGTLDPDAEGVLPIVIGKCTKLSDSLMSDEKEYRAEIKLGVKTDTLDLSGTVLEKDDTIFEKEQVISVIKSFEKEYEQLPPMYSAIKINGKKLYDLARKGEEVERKKRLVNIKSINLVEVIDEYTYVVDVVCSKGTYIRSLCSDIGEALGTFAAMGKLIRLRTGDFTSDKAYKLEELIAMKEEGKLLDAVITPEELLKDYEKAYCQKAAEKFLINGNKLGNNFVTCKSEYIKGEKYVVYYEGNLIGIYSNDGNFLNPDIILFDFNN